MEASSAFHRCVWQVLTRSAHCRHIKSTTKSLAIPSRPQTSRTSHRTFASTSQTKQEIQSPQPVPVSNLRNAADPVGLDSSVPQKPQLRDPNNRVDLSTISDNPPSDNPPTRRANASPTSPGAKLDAVFGAASRPINPYARTIQQTDDLNRPAPSRQSDGSTFDLNLSRILNFVPQNQSGSPPPNNVDSKIPLRLRPTLGRIQRVDPGRGLDLFKAFGILEAKCSVNNVKMDAIQQKFHTRRGQARKLRRCLRWRKVFKAGFLEECARVRRMKNQGW